MLKKNDERTFEGQTTFTHNSFTPLIPPFANTSKNWTEHYRNDKSVMELVCDHGIGHEPDVHGCDGCCKELVAKDERFILPKP